MIECRKDCGSYKLVESSAEYKCTELDLDKTEFTKMQASMTELDLAMFIYLRQHDYKSLPEYVFGQNDFRQMCSLGVTYKMHSKECIIGFRQFFDDEFLSGKHHVDNTLSCLLANLIVSFRTLAPLKFDFSRDAYSNKAISVKLLLDSIKYLHSQDLLLLEKGCVSFHNNSHEPLPSYCVPCNKLASFVNLFSPVCIKCQGPGEEKIVILRKTIKETKYEDGKYISSTKKEEKKCPVNNQTRKTQRILKRYNESLSRYNVSFVNESGSEIINNGGIYFLRRIFSSNLKSGGRLYGEFQRLKKECRMTLKIDNEETVELDYKTCHPRMAYNLSGLDYNGDAYQGILNKLEINENDNDSRDFIKSAVGIMLNTSSKKQASDAITGLIEDYSGESKKEPIPSYLDEIIYKEESEKKPEKKISSNILKLKGAEIRQLIQKEHEPIKDFFCSNKGLHLQYLDSCIALKIVSQLTKEGILVLPVHDSFIVQQRHTERLRELMIQSYKEEINGFEPIIKVS